MKNFDENMSDNELRELLKLRIISGNENDTLTQKLLDMEATLIFCTSPVIPLSVEKEKVFLRKLKAGNNFPGLQWLIIGVSIALVSLFFFIPNKSDEQKEMPLIGINKEQFEKQDMPILQGNDEQTEEDALTRAENKLSKLPSSQMEEGDTSISKPKISSFSNYGSRKNPPVFFPKKIHIKSSLPVLSAVQITENNKLRENMIKQIIKKDKKAWVMVPMGTDVYRGDTFSIHSFYMATTEVSNQEYRVFLNDLLIENRDSDYLIAVPDTARWSKNNFNDPFVKYYFSHPAYWEYPVLNITEQGAAIYCIWLTESVNEKIKNKYPPKKWAELFINDIRLPKDIEWDYAARGGKPEAIYGWPGNQLLTEKGEKMGNWKKENEGSSGTAGRLNDNAEIPAPARSYWPNSYGLYNMSGNAAELVFNSNDNKISIKGGSWSSSTDFLKIDAADEYAGPHEASPQIGFRPVFSAPRKSR